MAAVYRESHGVPWSLRWRASAWVLIERCRFQAVAWMFAAARCSYSCNDGIRINARFAYAQCTALLLCPSVGGVEGGEHGGWVGLRAPGPA